MAAHGRNVIIIFFSFGRDSRVPNVAGFSRIGKNQRITLIVDETNSVDTP